eukprot:jgi/Psemu1/70420/estExt_Genemark1.C_20910001
MKFATSIVAAIATTGAAFTVIPQKLSHPSQLNALNTMGSISSITAESPKEVLSRVQDAGLTLTNPNDLYWMVDFLKEKYYDNGDYYYPIKTVCDGESIDVKFYCPFEPSLSPHYLELYGSRDERASIYETTMKKYNRINSEKTSAICTPYSSYGDTQIVAYFYSMMYYINDQTAHLKLPESEIESELIDILNDDILIYLNEFMSIFEPEDAQDLERIWDFLDFYQPYFSKVDGKIVLDEKYLVRTPAQMPLIKTICEYVSEQFAPSKNITQVIWEVVRYIKGVKDEIHIRGDKSFTLSLQEYDDFRDKVTASPMAHAVSDLTHERFSYEAYTNPAFMELENRCSEIITYFNDVCTSDRERLDEDPFNSVFILMDLDPSLNFAKSCDVVVEHAYNKMQAFLKLKEEILESASDEEERLALARMIKTREDSLIGYVLHEVCCVEDGYARDHKPLMKAFLEEEITKSLAEKVKFNPVESESVRLN